MSDMGNIEFDRDAIYIKLPTNQIAFSDIDGLETTQNGPGEKMVRDLQSTSTTLDEKLAQSELRLFADSAPIQSSDVEQQGSRVRRPAEFRGGESTDDKKKLAFAEYHIEDSDEEQENGDEDENMEDVDEDEEAIDYNNNNFKATAGDDSDEDNDEDLVQEQSDEDDFPIPKADDDEYADDDDDEVDDDENDEDDDGDDEDDEMDEDAEEDDEDNDEESEEDIGKNYDFHR
jgi:hypothetical protein